MASTATMGVHESPSTKEFREHPRFIVKDELEERILDMYEKYDLADTHNIEARYIPDVMRSLGCCPTEKEIKEVIENTCDDVDQRYCPAIYFIPFMKKAITDHRFYPSNSQQLLEAFRHFDPEDRGYLTKEQFSSILMERGEPFEQAEFDEILQSALEPVTDTIPYEYYVNHLLNIPLDVYQIADKLEAERIRVEEQQKHKKRGIVEDASRIGADASRMSGVSRSRSGVQKRIPSDG